MEERSDVNRLGALTLALGDAQQDALREATGLSSSACAALVTLAQYPGTSITALSHVLGLTHSVTVRLVDGLVQGGLVTRSPGDDRRLVTLRLTEGGKERYELVRATRAEVLERTLSVLTAKDRAHLERLMSVLLTALTESRPVADHLCRLCDEAACGGDACPVEVRARALEGRRT